MIGWGWLVTTFGEKDAKRVAIGGGIILALVLIAGAAVLWLTPHDRKVVKADRAAANAEIGQRQVTAERAAGAAQTERETEIRNSQSVQEERAHEARRNRRSALDGLHDGL